MFKSIITAVLVAVVSSTAAFANPIATDWNSWDRGSTQLAEAYVVDNGGNEYHLTTDTDIIALAQEAAYKERNLIVNTHIGAENYNDLVAYGYDSYTVELPTTGLGYFSADGIVYVTNGYMGYVSAKDRLVDFFTARNENLNSLQQYQLDNNPIYSNNGVVWSNF